jgi:hypothetical protein
MVITSTMVQSHPASGLDDAPRVSIARLNDSTGPVLKSELVRKLFLPHGVPWRPLANRPWSVLGSRWRAQPYDGGNSPPALWQ